jgi:ribonucleoside-diphosphate reductase alpha chain
MTIMNTTNLTEVFTLSVASEMEPQEITFDVLLEKYAKGNERTHADIRARVASGLACVESEGLRDSLSISFAEALDKGFVPAGRIQSAVGTDIQATLINCFVQPVGDSVSEFKNGKPGIYTAVAEAAETMRRGGGVGYDFSHIRPAGSMVKGTHSKASGPVSFMNVFDSSCATVESAGARRGAQMGVLRCDHPDIETFVRAKDKGDLTNFNISIGVTDEFMRAVTAGENFELVHRAEPGKDLLANGAYQRADGKWVYRTIAATDLWEKVMHSTYDHAEPGILFIDRMNQENNLWYCETIEATNPCAEQPLPDYGCCCLGSIDLTKHVRDAFTEDAQFDFDSFAGVVHTAVRMLDNVLDATFWPLEKQKIEASNKRRIGLGFLGLGSALVMMGIKYNSEQGCAMAAKIAEMMRNEAYRASIKLASEKGSFPLLEAEKYLQSGFAKRLPADIREGIKAVGLRNSHLLSIAPTGTITLAFADNASNGIEPAFSWVYNRKKRLADGGHRFYEVADHAWRLYRHMGGDVSTLPEYFVTALEMTAQEHMQMMEAVQPFIDTAISKTVNVSADYPYDDFKGLYLEGWKAGLKGLATYRPNSVLGSVLSVGPTVTSPAVSPDPHVANDDPLHKQFNARVDGELESVTTKIQMWTHEGKRSVYVTTSFMTVDGVVDGKAVTIERPVEFFLAGSQRDAGQQWVDLSLRMLSMAARSGVSVAKTIENMREVAWDKGPVRYGYATKADGTQVPRFHDSEVAAIGYALQEMLVRRGFLTSEGQQVPIAKLSKLLEARLSSGRNAEAAGAPSVDASPHALRAGDHFAAGTGKKCGHCGAHDVHRIDGCTQCVSCGTVGSCG